MRKRLISAIALFVMAITCGILGVGCNGQQNPPPVDDGKITITFISNGTVFATETGYSVHRIVMPNTPTKTGYTFSGWYTEENGGGKKVTEVFLFNNSMKEDFNVYAYFTATSYSISYYIDSAFGGAPTSAQNPTSYTSDTNFALLAPTITHPTAKFVGWFSGDTKITNLKGRSGNLNLVARFVTYEAQWTYDSQDSNYIYFGSYPQSQVKDETLINSLNEEIGTARPNNSSLNGWTALENYATNKRTNIIFHKDVMFDGNEYRAIYFKKYRPSIPDLEASSTSEQNSLQDDNGYLINTVYWFKFEPIKWQVLGYKNSAYTTLFSALVLDSREQSLGSWQVSPPSSANRDKQNVDGANWGYYYSTTRFWLEDTFLYEAFNVEQSAYYIRKVSVINDDKANVIPLFQSLSTHNVSAKCYLMSREELDESISMRQTLDTYHATTFSNETRKKGYTDYAKAMGLAVEGEYAPYWIRGGGSDDARTSQFVNAKGEITTEFDNTWNTSIGLAPALVLIKNPTLPLI